MNIHDTPKHGICKHPLVQPIIFVHTKNLDPNFVRGEVDLLAALMVTDVATIASRIYFKLKSSKSR